MSDLIQVSPKFRLDRETWKIKRGKKSFDYDDKTAARLIFQDRMQGWFFEPVRKLLNKDQTIVAVHVVTPLIEALENYIRGESSQGKSGEFFKARARVIFPSLNKDAIDLLFKGVRCGFAHEGFLKDKNDNNGYNIIISSAKNAHSIVYDEPEIYDKPEMIIYAHQYVTAIQTAFEDYYSQLEHDEEKLSGFFQVWEKQWEIKKRTAIEISGTRSS